MKHFVPINGDSGLCNPPVSSLLIELDSRCELDGGILQGRIRVECKVPIALNDLNRWLHRVGDRPLGKSNPNLGKISAEVITGNKVPLPVRNSHLLLRLRLVDTKPSLD